MAIFHMFHDFSKYTESVLGAASHRLVTETNWNKVILPESIVPLSFYHYLLLSILLTGRAFGLAGSFAGSGRFFFSTLPKYIQKRHQFPSNWNENKIEIAYVGVAMARFLNASRSRNSAGSIFDYFQISSFL